MEKHTINLADFPLFWKIVAQVNLYNDYQDQVMTLDIKGSQIRLLIDSRIITEGDDQDTYNRIKQINHEEGNSLMK